MFTRWRRHPWLVVAMSSALAILAIKDSYTYDAPELILVAFVLTILAIGFAARSVRTK